MASERYLAIVGLSEEDTARLRLLLRMVAGNLENRWRWGTEENADLVIVDPTEMNGQIARNRAFSSGRRCALFSETEALRDGELRLRQPVKADDLAAVLSGTATTSELLNSPVLQHKDDFYDLDTLTPEFELEDEDAQLARSRQREANPALGLDEYLKPDEASQKPQFAVPIELNEDTLIEGTAGSSKRAERRVADSVDGLRKQAKPEPNNIGPPVKRGVPTSDPGKFALRNYLQSNLLGGPATFALDGAPALTLDPKEKKFHAAGSLRALEPYCATALTASGWKPVTTADLAQVRAAQPGRPYARLVWLDALVNSHGRLASHLDPGGRYRLKIWPELEREYTNHARIATAMKEPAKLNEIAAASGATMTEVFAVVSAFDAVGLVEVQQRLPRHGAPAPSRTGLLARLRKPFGKG